METVKLNRTYYVNRIISENVQNTVREFQDPEEAVKFAHHPDTVVIRTDRIMVLRDNAMGWWQEEYRVNYKYDPTSETWKFDARHEGLIRTR